MSKTSFTHRPAVPISRQSTLEEFRIIGPPIFGRKRIREIFVRTHDVDTCKVECLSLAGLEAPI